MLHFPRSLFKVTPTLPYSYLNQLQRQKGDKGKKGTTPLSGGVPLIRLNQVSLLGRRRREKIIREMITVLH